MVPSRADLRFLADGNEQSSGRSAGVAPDDAELLAAIRAGRPSAAAEFYDRVRPQVDQTIFRLLGATDREHADLVQLAVINLVSSVGRFRGECLLDTWVGKVTAHVVYKHLRRRGAERRLLERVVLSAPESDIPLQRAREETARDVLECVTAHLADMDTGQSWAFVLHDVFGYNVREMAGILGISESAAQSRLVRGRRLLHDRLAADPELSISWRTGKNK